jgi:toxin ParE1/3/4
MRLELSRFVEGDLDDIAAFIAQDNPRRAVTFIQEIRAKFRDLQQHPLFYQLCPEIGDGARMATVGRYALLFRMVDSATVRVERVVFGGRNLHDLYDA